jgi:hypothetical protein
MGLLSATFPLLMGKHNAASAGILLFGERYRRGFLVCRKTSKPVMGVLKSEV